MRQQINAFYYVFQMQKYFSSNFPINDSHLPKYTRELTLGFRFFFKFKYDFDEKAFKTVCTHSKHSMLLACLATVISEEDYKKKLKSKIK